MEYCPVDESQSQPERRLDQIDKSAIEKWKMQSIRTGSCGHSMGDLQSHCVGSR